MEIRLDLAKYALERNDNMANLADTKAGLFSAFVFLLMSLMLNESQNVLSLFHSKSWLLKGFALVGVSFFVVGMVVTYGATILSIYPRIKPTSESVVFFGSVAKMPSEEELRRSFLSKDLEVMEVVISQVYSTSKIVYKKFRLLQVTALATIITSVGWLIVTVLLILQRV